MTTEEKKPVKIRVQENALVVMVGVSGSGKSSLAARLFPGCAVSSDACRRMLAGNPAISNDELQKFSEGAFEVFRAWIRARLRHGLLTVADSTALRPEYRDELFKIGQEEHVRVHFLLMDTPFEECVKRNAGRPELERTPEAVIKRQFSSLNRSRGWLRHNAERVRPGDEVVAEIVPAIRGIDAQAIDVIGDVHGCLEELIELIEKLGYHKGRTLRQIGPLHMQEVETYVHPEGRKLVFVGDLIDRGPEPYKVLDFVRQHVDEGLAHMPLSNHERKLRNYLAGRNVTVKPEFQAMLDSFPADLDKNGLKRFLFSLRPYLQWTSPKGEEWVVAHAAFDPRFAGKVDKGIEEYCAYGPTRGTDPVTGRPDRIPWWNDYRPGPKVVYGHLITDDGKPRVVNGTYGIDTGCVHGGSLTALRLPEEEFLQVKAKRLYHGDEQAPQAAPPAPSGVGLALLTTRRVTVRGLDGGHQSVMLHERDLAEAIDALSTRTIRPDKLVWLSPTMSPGPVSDDPGEMEDPVTAAKWMFAHAPAGARLCAQVKHMGSRGTWLCERNGKWRIHCWTRNGYEMFDEPRRSEVYALMRDPLDALAEAFASDTLLLDSEVMPFNQHGDEWLERTFMQTAAAGHVSRLAMARAAKQAGRDSAAQRLLGKMENIQLFGEAANRFCWPVGGASEVKVGIFDVLHPSPAAGHRDLAFKLGETLSRWPIIRPTESAAVENTEESLAALRAWFDRLTGSGVEGVVLKYDDREMWSASRWPQQALKVRGKDYLRLVYGPQYLEPDFLAALRAERRTDTKMRMAFQQALLGREALRRNFAEKRPFEEWHEPVLAIMAAERATVDPRL